MKRLLLRRAHEKIRERVPILDRDRPPSHDLLAITDLIAAGEVERACAMKVN